MRRVAAPLVLLLACALASAGCRQAPAGAGPGAAAGADALVASLNSFTEELLSKVESAPDRKAGLAEAQALLDARKGALTAQVAALKRDADFARVRGRWLEAEVDNTDRVHRLQLKYSDESARDPEFSGRLDKLVADYDSIFK
jgi:predicted component of type VI protein secretion system